MNKNCKKGFTIVELIIVIAVIAILAAVLIPTFSNLIKRANVANDTALVRNLNTALAADGAKQHDTMREALAAANAFGYDVSKINAKADGNEILWDSYNDCFVYKDESGINYIPDSQIKGEAGKGAQLWHIANKGTSDISSEYSNYLGEGTYAGTLKVSTGLDVGDHTEVTAVEYTGEGENVIIYMNGGTLTVTETNATAQQYFYGSASQADITTGTSCFHVYGAIAKTNVLAGKVVAENGGMVIVSEAATSASVEKNGGIVLAASGVTLGSNVALSTDAEKAAYVLEISTAAELASFRDRVNAGMTYEGLTVKLTANIDLSNQGNWNPIGNRYALKDGTSVDTTEEVNKAYRKAFKGTFDGQGHTISGLFIDSNAENYKAPKAASKDGNKNTSSYAALFGYVDNATVKNFTINGTVLGTDVAGVIGILGANCTVDRVVSNVTVGGQAGENEEQSARGKVGGIINMTKGDGSTISNCINTGSASSEKQELTENNKQVTRGDYAGGIIALIQHNNIIIENCKNTGAISTYNYHVGGIVGGAAKGGKTGTEFSVTIKNCENEGDITSTAGKEGHYAGAIIGLCGSYSKVTIKECRNVRGTISPDVTYDNDKLVGLVGTKDNINGVTNKNDQQ